MAKELKYRYFVCDGELGASIGEQAIQKRKENHAALDALAARFGAEACACNLDGKPWALAWKEPEPTKRPGLCHHSAERHASGVVWQKYRPHRGTKLGKQIESALNGFREFEASNWLTEQFGARRMVYGDYKMAIAVAGFKNGAVLLSVPTTEEEPYDPPETLREIKRSEWIALTEEA